MMNDHLLRFRQKSTEDLLAKQAELEGQETTFIAQSMGGKSFTRDLQLIESKLQAIAYVLAQRGYTTPVKAIINPNIGTVDFSATQ